MSLVPGCADLSLWRQIQLQLELAPEVGKSLFSEFGKCFVDAMLGDGTGLDVDDVFGAGLIKTKGF